jgi:hypothetical protein|eukprot:CAMPEP_0174290702 /NCGR_PEP_ID=MMETSP0809-20121228/29834_1 /TAXON_ID=73025 ORGANISM="Eutreptiella gymnastica-like, Strain CCMP1594" /NCGR_SAMPLE_ID=MMETSP0809 /ASSEMBLY_ACC=CAM_ASM_000658 /LENGTH=99 /DNA_ID=CAMNT_0015389567 /DNA_START=900 /DNA_END=1199 /DNA_ORIENTATION=-
MGAALDVGVGFCAEQPKQEAGGAEGGDDVDAAVGPGGETAGDSSCSEGALGKKELVSAAGDVMAVGEATTEESNEAEEEVSPDGVGGATTEEVQNHWKV